MDFPTLAEYRAPILRDIGGVIEGTVSLDPDITDFDAARSLISSRLYDNEKLSGAFGGEYTWVPRHGDSRRIEDRGYRVRYMTVIQPPDSGTYKIQFYGYGETRDIPASLPAANVQAIIRALDPEDLGTVDVVKNPDGTLSIDLKQRIGLGVTAGAVLGQSGVGICLMSRDFSQPLRRGVKWYLSPKIPFETEDGVTGVHACINQALNDVIIPDLFPIWFTLPQGQRPRSVSLRDWAPWLLPEQITGFYAPTDWQMTTVFQPPVSGTYTLTLQSWQQFGPFVTPLAYNASGAAIEASLRTIPGVQDIFVSPSASASSYTITWRTMFHNTRVVPSAGFVLSSRNDRMHDPFRTILQPSYLGDFETPTLLDPGYDAGHTWFVAVDRPGGSRVCPQTYPLRADGTLDTTKDPIKGTQWVESTSGLMNDLDQAYPPVEKVYLAGLRYAYGSIAAASPQGEQDAWLKKGQMAAAQAAGRIVYGPIKKRGGGQAPGWPGAGIQQKGIDFWLPGR